MTIISLNWVAGVNTSMLSNKIDKLLGKPILESQERIANTEKEFQSLCAELLNEAYKVITKNGLRCEYTPDNISFIVEDLPDTDVYIILDMFEEVGWNLIHRDTPLHRYFFSDPFSIIYNDYRSDPYYLILRGLGTYVWITVG